MRRNEEGDSSRIPFVFKLIAVILALVVWQLIAVLVDIDIVIASPLDVCIRLCSIWRESLFWQSIGYTLGHIILGYLAGLTLAVILAFLSDRFRTVEVLLWPYMVTVRSVPVASIVVICLLLLSNRYISSFVAFLIVLPIVYQNILTGLKNRDAELEEVSDVYNVTGFEKVKNVLFPQIVPYMMSACTVTAGLSWKAGVAAEVIATPNGSIGRQLYLSKTYLDTVELFTWTFVLIILSTVCEKFFVIMLKKIFEKWC